LLNKILFGTTLPQEYICVAEEKLSNKSRLYLIDDETFYDLADSHLFIGYCPLIIAISCEKNSNLNDLLQSKNIIKTVLRETKDNILAQLKLKKTYTLEFNKVKLFLFEGVKGSHRFLSKIHIFTNSLKYKLTAEKKVNIYLKGNLYEQVKIAYSIPRKISLVSLGKNNLFNIFPTDINGRIGNQNYVISLRKNGKANKQVRELKKIILSEMVVDSYKKVYSLGVNHTKDLRDKKEFDLSERLSQKFSLPVPKNALRYFELEFINDMQTGVHNLCFFRIVNSVNIEDSKSTLAHIHRDYAEWRINNGIISEFLLR
jgi:flavin reductase (DIM6/NTAB) family NADH-FMN oxidoreductase RutF